MAIRFISKGKGKNRKVIPIKSGKISKGKFKNKPIKTESNFRIPTLPNDPPKSKFPKREHLIFTDNFKFRFDPEGMFLTLDDFGWHWSGDENSINEFLHRIVLSEDLIKPFEEGLEEAKLDFDDLKPFMLDTIKDDDGIYTISGDNSRWKFGEDTDLIDVGAEFDNFVDEGDLEEGERDDFENEFWQNFTSPSFEEFVEKNGDWIRENMRNIIKNAEDFEDYAMGIEDLRSNVEDAYRELELDHILEASGKSVNELQKRRKVKGKEALQESSGVNLQ